MNPLADPQVQETLRGVFRLVTPEIALVGTACVAFLGGCFFNCRGLWFLVSLAGVILAAILTPAVGIVKTDMPSLIFVSPIVPDATAEFVRWMAIITAFVLLFMTWPEVSRENAAEYYACLLVAIAGVSIVGRANDLIVLFLGLELLSIPTYILLYLPARSRLNQEAAAKYFLLSIMSSGVLLFGFSYLYGLAGSTNLAVVVDAIAKANAETLSPLALIAAVMVITAMGFRVTAVPFHFYAPDVYEGGPPGVVAQLAFLPKVAGFAVLARVLGFVRGDPLHLPFDVGTQIPLLLWILAILTMCVGNVLALLQDNFRRLLAYSSVAHAGYMLMGLVVASSFPNLPDAVRSAPAGSVHFLATGGVNGLLVYLAAYGMMTVGAFAVVLYLSAAERPVEAIDDLAGAGRSHPLSAAAMTIFLLSLIGMPLTAGFVGKFLLFVGTFSAPVHADMGNLYRVLAIVAAVNAAVGAYYYLRVIGVMYLRTPLRPLVGSRAAPTLAAVVALAAGTVFFGIYPEPLNRAALKAAPEPEVLNPQKSRGQ